MCTHTHTHTFTHKHQMLHTNTCTLRPWPYTVLTLRPWPYTVLTVQPTGSAGRHAAQSDPREAQDWRGHDLVPWPRWSGRGNCGVCWWSSLHSANPFAKKGTFWSVENWREQLCAQNFLGFHKFVHVHMLWWFLNDLCLCSKKIFCWFIVGCQRRTENVLAIRAGGQYYLL